MTTQIQARFDEATEENDHWNASLILVTHMINDVKIGLDYWFGVAVVLREFSDRAELRGGGDRFEMEFRRKVTNEVIEFLRGRGEWV